MTNLHLTIGGEYLIQFFLNVEVYIMSLVVLKRKANTKYSKISSKKGDFSINNPRRVDSHSNKPQTQTPMKGNVPRGHGACCGHYPVVINKSQYKNYDFHVREFNGDKANPGISVKNNRASISTRNKWMTSTYPNYVVKKMGPDDYSQYNNRIRSQHATKDTDQVKDNCNGLEHCDKRLTSNNIVKKIGTMDYSEYLKTKFMKKHCLPPPNSKAAVPVPRQGPCSSGSTNDETENGTEKGICE